MFKIAILTLAIGLCGAQTLQADQASCKNQLDAHRDAVKEGLVVQDDKATKDEPRATNVNTTVPAPKKP